jgi:isopentenyl-diphosphate delta-isomerase
MKSTAQRILIVDENDNCIGEEDKEKCHDGDGILHRAFLTMVLDEDGNLLLAQRSEKKRLWPGFWDGTIASHVTKGEDYLQASKRRLVEELGLITDTNACLFKFRYKAVYKDVGAEHEICAVTLVSGVTRDRLLPDSDEIADIRSIDPRFLIDEITGNGSGSAYTPWLILALEELHLRRNGWPLYCK